MDPISGAASIIALIEATGLTIKLIRKLAAKNEHAREEQMQAARRLFDLSSILGQILAFHNSLNPQSGTSHSAPELSANDNALVKGAGIDSSLAHCETEMNALRLLLEELMQQKRFVWVYKSDKVQKRLDQIKVDIDTLKSIFQNSML